MSDGAKGIAMRMTPLRASAMTRKNLRRPKRVQMRSLSQEMTGPPMRVT